MKTNKYFVGNVRYNNSPEVTILQESIDALSKQKEVWCIANKNIIDEIADEKLDIIHYGNQIRCIIITLTYFTKNQ